MKVVDKISVTELQEMAQKMGGNIVKADVDIAKKIVIVDMPMHFEGEQELPRTHPKSFSALTRTSGGRTNRYRSSPRGIVGVPSPERSVQLTRGTADDSKKVLGWVLSQGSKQDDLWGINLLPAKYGTDEFVVYDSMINIKPRQNNKSMSVASDEIRTQLKSIVDEVVHE